MGHEPKHNRGNSEQEVATPYELIQAVENRFGPISWDLAASAWCNWGRDGFYSEEEDSLTKDWTLHNGVLWLNPDFARLKVWAIKSCLSQGPGRTILMLSPYTCCAWARRFCHDEAYVIGLSGRATFVGHKQSYPKDLMLTVYTGMGLKGYETWDWR